MACRANFNFVEEVSSDNVCSICTLILKDPVLVECCGQSFCEECLKKWLQMQKSCPHCRQESFNFIKDLRMKRTIDRSKITCPNRPKGCEEITTVGECDTHLKTCLFVEVDCINDCGVKMLRKELANHIANECSKRTVSCQYCNEEGMYKDITTESHIDKCPSFPLDCPNNCGHDKIQRKDLLDHQKECPLEPVKCPFFEAGCKQEIQRNKLQNHITNDCLKCKVNCQYCNEEGKKEDIVSKTHTDDCPSLPVHCPNSCGHKKIQRKDLLDHQKVCLLEPVKCPFFEAGCKQEITRKELTAHKALNTANHLELTLMVSMNTQRQLEEATQTAKATESELEQVTQMHTLTQQKLDEETEKAKATLEEIKTQAKVTQDQLKTTQDEMKQLSLKYNGLAQCVTKHLLANPTSLTDISNIKTALESMTTMLKKSKQYCLPLVSTPDGIKRSPIFYVHPGYKMYIADAVYLLKGEHDEKIEWPMLRMNIELKAMNNVYLSEVIICPQCGYTGNRLEGDREMEEIERIIYTSRPQAVSTLMPDSVLITVMPHNCRSYSD